MDTMKNIAVNACLTRVSGLFRLIFLAVASVALAACSVLPKPPERADVYDFGPGSATAAAAPAQAQALPPLALADVEATGLPEASSALLYRLAYANAQQLQPYTQARWSQPPAILVQQALREQLGQGRAVLSGDDGLAMLADRARMPTVLRVQLEEFSQVFESPQRSHGLLRLRALLADNSARGEVLVAQRLFVVQRPASTPDAAGGARALAEAAAQAAQELADWVQRSGR
ncbi:ABC-type transport auxiliary lipoprotein family protein [Melaminivora jejuensis]|uniref:ABC-type transport auxiliary lipoprotein family protein n=1 Tax=Melaminivora jejuensis TaxID=1267217 RepID=UPI001AE03E9C|nr:ABC-type transport auxiliary lipoprotein family protein [Melaminivora jejuensis]UHJ65165.1 ABC-type transport auxiliary lipoprotein family protein [Melaminivora jejuensis]